MQAKRYAAGDAVQRPELQGFIGALDGRGASKEVFVTTSRFSHGAREYADSIPQRIVLIDGPRLTLLLPRSASNAAPPRPVRYFLPSCCEG